MSISIEALQEAISIKEEIEALEQRLNKLLAGSELAVHDAEPVVIKKHRKKMSAAARAKISAAQKARWASQKR